MSDGIEQSSETDLYIYRYVVHDRVGMSDLRLIMDKLNHGLSWKKNGDFYGKR